MLLIKNDVKGAAHTGEQSIFFFGIPAYGHLHSNLYFARCLSERGYRMIYYSMEPYRKEIEANGCEYRPYPLGQKFIDASDGDKLLKLYRLILQYTCDMLPHLMAEFEREKPCCILFDSLALWGRAVGEMMGVPSFSFYSIAAMGPIGGKAFRSYAAGFLVGILRYAGELPGAIHIGRQLRKVYGIKKLDLLSVLMNTGSLNLMGYARRFQPGGSGFGKRYVFLGPLAPYRKVIQSNDFTCPAGRLIYISLGTIFNQDDELLEEILAQFGGTGQEKDLPWNVVMAWDMDKTVCCTESIRNEWKRRKNFIIRPFLNQGEVLRHADLFITAGGMNSIHEALYYGVPCLMCPQQGEQLLNARQFEALGFGRILRHKSELYKEALKTMKLKYNWDEERRAEMTAVHMDILELFDKNIRKNLENDV